MLILVPAAFLVLMLLGAIAVDSGATYLGRRQLQATVDAAANDAAGGALSDTAFYRQGTVRIDPARAAVIVCQDIGAQRDQRLRGATVGIAVDGATIWVEGHAEVPAVFGRLIPGFSERPVSAEAGAVAAEQVGQQPASPPLGSSFVALPC